jgi:choline dehydrogenase-like flavoprotein
VLSIPALTPWLVVGVVNAQLKVYDTTNLRVVDASAMPTQISAHLMSTLYGIAEKAADLIKASWPSARSASTDSETPLQ